MNVQGGPCSDDAYGSCPRRQFARGDTILNHRRSFGRALRPAPTSHWAKVVRAIRKLGVGSQVDQVASIASTGPAGSHGVWMASLTDGGEGDDEVAFDAGTWRLRNSKLLYSDTSVASQSLNDDTPRRRTSKRSSLHRVRSTVVVQPAPHCSTQLAAAHDGAGPPQAGALSCRVSVPRWLRRGSASSAERGTSVESDATGQQSVPCGEDSVHGSICMPGQPTAPEAAATTGTGTGTGSGDGAAPPGTAARDADVTGSARKQDAGASRSASCHARSHRRRVGRSPRGRRAFPVAPVAVRGDTGRDDGCACGRGRAAESPAPEPTMRQVLAPSMALNDSLLAVRRGSVISAGAASPARVPESRAATAFRRPPPRIVAHA